MKSLIAAAICALSVLSGTEAIAQYIPPKGFVPDRITAIAIARAVLTPIYGLEQIRSEEPLVAKEMPDRWLVTGTLTCGGRVCLGGTAEIEIAKSDGRVLRVIHGQ